MELNIETIQKIIHEQFPEYDDLPIRKVKESGHDNHSYHLGDHLSLRFPSAEAYATQVIKEARYCNVLQKGLTLSITCPIALGIPSKHFPFHFSINQWIDGESVTYENINNKQQLAFELANFLLNLQKCDTKNGPLPGIHNFYRGGLLTVYHDETIEAIKSCEEFDKVTCLEIWKKGLKSGYLGKSVWLHGDLEIGNILVKNDKLCAVIDFGNMAIGDPACDYVIAWTYFDHLSRKIFFDTLNLDVQTINRARSWAIWKALITLNDANRKTNAQRTMKEILKDI